MPTKAKLPNPKGAIKYFETKLKYVAGPTDVETWLEQGSANVLDLRDPKTFGKGHVPGAINFPRDKWSQHSQYLSKRKVNVLYCYDYTCHLAPKACIHFAKMGYPVMEMEGGFTGWSDKGLKVVR